MAVTTFYIIRHGESEANAKKIVQGALNTPLSAAGKAEAYDLAGRLKHLKTDKLFASPMLRAQQTAEIIAGSFSVPVETAAELYERNYGKFEGMQVNEFLSLYTNWNTLTEEERWNHAFADEETQQHAVGRLTGFLRKYARIYEGKTILVVCHGALIRSLLIKLNYGTWDSIAGIQNCGYIRVEIIDDDITIKETNGIIKWKDIKV